MCRICGNGGGPCCFSCTSAIGGYGARVQTALIAAENARRLAEQERDRERERHAETITTANARIAELLAGLTDARESLATQLAELRALREEIRRREAPGAASARLIPVSAAPANSSAPPLVPGRLSDGAGSPPAVGRVSTADPTTAPPAAEASSGRDEDPASQRYSLLELD